MYKNAYGNGKIEMKKLPFNCLTGDFFFFLPFQRNVSFNTNMVPSNKFNVK